jgi:hypothetical protein
MVRQPIWSLRVLQSDKPKADDNLFLARGHSLLSLDDTMENPIWNPQAEPIDDTMAEANLVSIDSTRRSSPWELQSGL